MFYTKKGMINTVPSLTVNPEEGALGTAEPSPPPLALSAVPVVFWYGDETRAVCVACSATEAIAERQV